MKKYPPIAKVYEAYSCIADKRIELKENEAIVTSSNNTKTYIVKWDNNDYSSTDNATFWQNYPGYPIIAVLMLQNKLNYDKDIIPLFANINWYELNNKYKRDYEKAIDEVLAKINYDSEIIREKTYKTYQELINLAINIKRKI